MTGAAVPERGAVERVRGEMIRALDECIARAGMGSPARLGKQSTLHARNVALARLDAYATTVRAEAVRVVPAPDLTAWIQRRAWESEALRDSFKEKALTCPYSDRERRRLLAQSRRCERERAYFAAVLAHLKGSA